MRTPLSAVGALFLLGLALAAPPVAAGSFIDPLDQPAKQSAKPANRPLRGLANAGERVVAVGERGRIILSDDAGKTWRQARVPVSSDLNAVSFASPRLGWAVGHDGVILHTQDGGESWELQFEGRRLEALLLDHYQRQAKAGRSEAGKMLEDIGSMMQPGPSSFFLDVAFESATSGIAVGKFGLILGTSDGGRTWVPQLEHIANSEYLHLSAVRRIAGRTWVVGERGHVWVRDAGKPNFEPVAVEYEGGLFGIVGDAQFVLAYGMRGNAFRSSDGGKRWARVDTGVGGGISDGAVLPGGRVVLAAQSGQLLVSKDGGHSFKPMVASVPMMYAAVLGLPSGQLVLAGLSGAQLQTQSE